MAEISRRNTKSSKSKIKSLFHSRPFSFGESRSITNAMINSIGEGVIMLDEYGYISGVNQPAIDTLGFERHELEGSWIQDILPSYDKDGKPVDPSERLMAQAFFTGRPVSGTVSYRRKDGSFVVVYNTSSPFIVKGKPIGGIVVFHDVSKELQIERAKDEFVSLASHQLRTPLTSIKFFAELLKDPYYGKLSSKQKDYLDKILFSTDRMINLVSDLLDISRLNLGRLEITPEVTNINNIVHNQLVEVAPIARSRGVKLQIKSKVDEDDCVKLDRTLFAQVIHNLLTNAIRYSAGKKHGLVKVLLEKDNKSYKISIADNGIGIPAGENSKIYERFYRAENAKNIEVEGTGLGLYLVKFIIESSGGSIRHTTQQNKGTTFYITIPKSGMKSASIA
jgi:two-component system phosphate regulon sensor histidine kinase PhoR